MDPKIAKPNPQAEFFTEEQCWILENWGDDRDPELSIARARVEPGVTTKRHRLKGIVERYVILEGQGRVEVGDLEAQDVGPGDVVFIPAGEPQRITNTGAGDLLFYCLCSPRFTPDCYEQLEE